MIGSERKPRFQIEAFLFGIALATIVGFVYAVFVRNVPLGTAAIIMCLVIVVEAVSGIAVYCRQQ
jgi:hypothetical protein